MADKQVSPEVVADIIAGAMAEFTKEQVQETLDILKDKYKLEPAAPEVIEVVSEETVDKSSFTVRLEEIGGFKMSVIKTWKAIGGESLMEAKATIQSAPTVLKEDISKEEAEMIKTALEEVGAVMSII